MVIALPDPTINPVFDGNQTWELGRESSCQERLQRVKKEVVGSRPQIAVAVVAQSARNKFPAPHLKKAEQTFYYFFISSVEISRSLLLNLDEK